MRKRIRKSPPRDKGCHECGKPFRVRPGCVIYCPECASRRKRCTRCSRRFIGGVISVCESCLASADVTRHDEDIPPPEVDPTREARLRRYERLAADGLPLFEM